MTFRAIDISGFNPATLRDQPAPVLQWVPLAQVVIDERYQRTITAAGRRAIQRMADEWDWTKFQPILAAATPDGRFAVVDGQHRAHAAALTGLDSLPALVVPMTPVQQAAAFTAVNTSAIRLSRTQVFKARLAAGDPVAVEAARLCEEAGCRLMTFNPNYSQRRNGDIFTHALILRMVAAGEGAAVVAGLRAIRQSEQGQQAVEAGKHMGPRVYDQAVVMPWLLALASSQRFLSLPLSEIFDEIDWEDERATASAWARRDGRPMAAVLHERIVAVLRAALDARAAA